MLNADELSSYLEKCDFPPPGEAVSCAVSGGADSSALALLAKAQGLELQIIFVNHQLRPESAAEAQEVEALAKKLDADFCAVDAELAPSNNDNSNLEARARDARYCALDSIDPNAMLGHTADDQAETLLLNLLWSSGPAGLAGMKKNQRRPILSLRRQDTEAICKLAGISPVIDPTNTDPKFRRSRIRHEVIPLLNQVADKDIVPILCRSTEIFRQNTNLLNTLTTDIDPTDAKGLQELDPFLAAWVIKSWLSKTSPPDLAAVERVLSVARGEILATEIPGGYRVSRSAMRLKLESV